MFLKLLKPREFTNLVIVQGYKYNFMNMQHYSIML